ncbi:zinc finger protein Pegasus-like isoform 2-T2 [Erethizon dorsatum]
MGEKKPEPLDFVKDFQEYLTQQTHHVNMISGSVSGDKEAETLQEAGTDGDQNGLGHPSVEVSLDENSGMLVDGFERTFDGKFKCRYCNYASKGTGRLTEHVRIHTVRCPDEKPFMIQQPSAQAVVSTVSASIPQSPSPTSPEHWPLHGQRNYSPVAGPSSEPRARTSTPSIGNSQPSTPAPTLPIQDPQFLQHCQHCDMYFADNIIYTIHMGCHGYENPFQCNMCGCKCKNKYDFACHFARGQHNQH